MSDAKWTLQLLATYVPQFLDNSIVRSRGLCLSVATKAGSLHLSLQEYLKVCCLLVTCPCSIDILEIPYPHDEKCTFFKCSMKLTFPDACSIFGLSTQ